MKKILVFIFSAIVIFTSCKKENASPEPDVTISKIYGKWNMISSAGGFTGIPEKPSTFVEIVIGQDNVLKTYIGGALTTQAHFVVNKVVSSSTSFYKLSFDDVAVTELVVRKAKRDTLILGQIQVEGFTSVYIREK